MPKRTTKSSRQDALQTPGQIVRKNPLANLYRVAATDQFARVEDDPTLDQQEKLATLSEIFESLVGTINRLASPAPSKAPELWAERDPQSVENINEFILRVYASYKGMTMAHLSHLDPQGHRAWYNWKVQPKNKNAALPLLTKKQANDQALARMSGEVSLAGMTDRLPQQFRDLLRLKRAVSNRRRRSKPSSPK